MTSVQYDMTSFIYQSQMMTSQNMGPMFNDKYPWPNYNPAEKQQGICYDIDSYAHTYCDMSQCMGEATCTCLPAHACLYSQPGVKTIGND